MSVALLFLTGLFLSAFFSGSETGFYRVTRLRLVLDANEGQWVARGLVALTNNPALFVATTLIGNNVANYITSLAVVLMARNVSGAPAWELAAPIAVTPLVFVYGELLPKYLFYHSPNFLLRRAGPLFLVFTLLFAPVAALLGALGWLLESVLGQKPLRVTLELARTEVQQLLREGGEAGILRPAQQRLSLSLFSVAAQPAARRQVPLSRAPAVLRGAKVEDALHLARRHRRSALLVREKPHGPLIGYVRVIDLRLQAAAVVQQCRQVPRISHTSSHLAALIELQTHNEEIACLVDDQGETLGVIYSRDLAAPLLR